MWTDNHCFICVRYFNDETRYNVRSPEVLSQRDESVPRLDGTCKDLREKGLIGHVGAGVYQKNLSPIAPHQLSLQSPCRIEPGISAAYNNDSFHVHCPQFRFSEQAPVRERLCPSRKIRGTWPVWFGLRSAQQHAHRPGLRKKFDLGSESLLCHLAPASRSSPPANK